MELGSFKMFNIDFTIKLYRLLLDSLINSKYAFQNYSLYVKNPKSHVVILRHDVDSWPINALQMAKIENNFGIKATYYFRRSPLSFNEKILKQIIDLGHEIGYHYEDLSKKNGDYSEAIKSFETNLGFYRRYYPITTIAMHGKPLSKWDSKELWKKYNYKDYGLIGEPYLDINFNKMVYLTDTGNCWDGEKFSIRDYVSSKFNFNIHSTHQLIEYIVNDKLPDQIMLNIHPARWNANIVKWFVRVYILTVPKKYIKMVLKKIRK